MRARIFCLHFTLISQPQTYGPWVMLLNREMAGCSVAIDRTCSVYLQHWRSHTSRNTDPSLPLPLHPSIWLVWFHKSFIMWPMRNALSVQNGTALAAHNKCLHYVIVVTSTVQCCTVLSVFQSNSWRPHFECIRKENLKSDYWLRRALRLSVRPSLLLSLPVCLSVRMEYLGFYRTYFREIWYWGFLMEVCGPQLLLFNRRKYIPEYTND